MHPLRAALFARALVTVALAALPLAARGDTAWNPKPVGGIDMAYKGRYLQHPTFRRMMAAMPGLRKQAVALVNRTLGVRYSDDFSILLRFADGTDTTDISREKDMRTKGKPNLLSRARTGSYKLAGKPVVTITFYLEPFIAGTADYARTIIHEFSHGIMRKLITDEKTRAGLPGWFKEGLATHLAGQTPGRIALQLVSSKKSDPAGTLKGLGKLAKEKKPAGGSYYEYAIHTESVVALPGAKGLARLYAQLVKGTPFKEAIASVTGRTWQKFVAESDARAQQVFAALAAKNGWKAWKSALKASKRGDEEKLVAFMQKRPRSIFTPRAKLELARLWLKQKRKSKSAAKLLAEVRDRHMGEFTQARDVRLFLARALERQGRIDEAVAEVTTYLRDMVSAKPPQRQKAEKMLARLQAKQADQGESLADAEPQAEAEEAHEGAAVDGQ